MEDGLLQSDGRKGFLVFGPYVPMDAGEYRLVIFGATEEAGSAWADVASGFGTVKHARFGLSEMPHNAGGVIVSGRITLNDFVNDPEVRVYVMEQDEVQITGYRLGPED